jgi:hypothetical protein
MVAHLLCLTLAESARDALRAALDHYRTLDRFQMTIRHHDSSGLFPGDYAQTLRWKKGGKFELVVSKPVSSANTPSRAPNYYANGREVVSVGPNGQRSTDEIVPSENTSPGWEVTGGPILGALQGTHMMKFLFNPPAGLTASYEFGGKSLWEGRPARTIVGTFRMGSSTETVHFYLAKDAPRLLAMMVFRNGKETGARYVDQKENPTLPESLGTPPK